MTGASRSIAPEGEYAGPGVRPGRPGPEARPGATRPIIGFPRLERYVASQIMTVPGYLRTLDVRVLSVLGCRQSRAGIGGGLVEIGVHHGKSFFILMALRRRGEKVLGIDLFSDDAINATGRHSGRSAALKDNARRLGFPLAPKQVIRIDSTTLDANGITDRVGPVRLIHVDGGHGYREVESDLRLGDGTVHDRGVIVVDDYRNGRWPDVREATDAFLGAEGARFAPFLVTPGKLYLADRRALAFYEGVVRHDPALGAAQRSSAEVAGRTVLALKWPRMEAVRQQMLQVTGNWRQRLGWS